MFYSKLTHLQHKQTPIMTIYDPILSYWSDLVAVVISMFARGPFMNKYNKTLFTRKQLMNQTSYGILYR